MIQMLGGYPREVALQALNQWPRTENGKFWPTENELIALCESIDDDRRRREHNARLGQLRIAATPSALVSPLKHELGQRFAAKVRAEDPRTAEIYLDHDALYRGEDEILLSPIGVLKLQPYAAIAQAIGLRIRERAFADSPEDRRNEP